MIDLKQIQNEINELQRQLNQKKNEYDEAKEKNLKEQYGANLGCGNCAYSCCVDLGDYHTNCSQGYCIYCNNYCEEYMPDNELSEYIRSHHYYSENMLDTLNDLFGVSDIIHRPELHQKALDILILRDKKGE
jgi:hypothetical protein